MHKKITIKQFLKKLRDGYLELILPRWCCSCGARLTTRQDLLCLSCWEKLPLAEKEMIPGNGTEQLFWGTFPIARGMILMPYEPKGLSGTLIHQIKYNHRHDLAQSLGRLMGHQWQSRGLLNDIDILIPVPLHWRRQWARGYNQSNEIAKGLSSVTGIPVVSHAIKRNRNNRSQTKMHTTERWANVQDLFQVVDSTALIGKHLLLVDDVITTGATLTALGLLLTREVPSCTLSVAGAARPQ